MRAFVVSIALGISGAPVFAQDQLGLSATPIECAALESLVVYGLIDGGIDGDTTAFTALLDQADGAVCMARLTDYGYGDGFRESDCVTAFDVMTRGWFVPVKQMTVQDAIRLILTSPTKTTCDEILFEMTAGL